MYVSMEARAQPQELSTSIFKQKSLTGLTFSYLSRLADQGP